MKVFIGIIIGIAAIVLVAVLALGYLGLVPGISGLFGANKPIKLGTTYTEQDYRSALAKSGTQFNDNLDNISLHRSLKVYGPPRQVSFDLTPAEAMAYMNLKKFTPDFPARDWDMRINADKTVEVSTMLEFEKLVNTLNMDDERIKNAISSVNKAGLKEVPVYLKGSPAIVNGQFNLDVDNLKIGRLSVPSQEVNKYKEDINNYFKEAQQNVPGFNIRNASIIDGKIHIDGTMPSSVSKKK